MAIKYRNLGNFYATLKKEAAPECLKALQTHTPFVQQGENREPAEIVASNSLDRALIVLELVDESPGLTNSDISRTLNIATSSCSYILSRLEKRGYLARDRHGRYRMGLTALTLAHGALRDMGFLTLAEPILYQLVNETGLSASIGVLERGHILVVDRLESPKLAKQAVSAGDSLAAARRLRRRELRSIGRELPPHSNALGKAILAFLPRQDILAIIRKQGLIRITPKTITSEAEFLGELESIRKRGYSTSFEEQYPGICALGAPIFDTRGVVRAALSLTGDPEQAKCEDWERFPEAVKAAARVITQRGTFTSFNQ
jgi:DNA-binding IclR family transcriptional regulator